MRIPLILTACIPIHSLPSDSLTCCFSSPFVLSTWPLWAHLCSTLGLLTAGNIEPPTSARSSACQERVYSSADCFVSATLKQRMTSFPQWSRQRPQWWRCQTQPTASPPGLDLLPSNQTSCFLCSLWHLHLGFAWVTFLQHICENSSS